MTIQVAYLTKAGRNALVESVRTGVGFSIANVKISSSYVDLSNSDIPFPVVVHTVVPPNLQVYAVGDHTLRCLIALGQDVGDFVIGSLGLYTSTGKLLAVANFPGAGSKIKSDLPEVLGNTRKFYVDIPYLDVQDLIANGPAPSQALIDSLFRGPVPWGTARAWAPSTDYVTGPPASFVTNANKGYVCKVDHTSGVSFDSTKWTEVSAYPNTDGDNFVILDRLPLTRGQCESALKTFRGTTGIIAPPEPTWLRIIHEDMLENHNALDDDIGIRLRDAIWPIGGVAWTNVRDVLKAHYSWDDNVTLARMSALQNYAKANR